MNGRENQLVEWKESWRDEYLRCLCGFANAWGGVLVIGKNNQGRTTGIGNARKLLGENSSRPFNPSVASAFFHAGEIEVWGCGIQRIFDACSSAGTPAPVVAYGGNDQWFAFPFSEDYLDLLGESGVGKKSGEGSPKTTEKTPDQIINLLRENPAMSLADVAEEIGKSLSAVERASSKLVKSGQIRHVGPKKGGHWEVRIEHG
jgi:ATP-dependent DNA helicase RecG